ncbi:MAG: PAS domain-containing protein, partial [Pseudomonadota bacterium]
MESERRPGAIDVPAEQGKRMIGAVGPGDGFTERNERTEPPGETHHILMSAMNAVSDLIVLIDRDFRVQYTNFKGLDPVPPSAPEKPTTCYERFRHLDEPCPDCTAMSVFETGRASEREMISPWDGRTKEIRAFPVFDTRGRVNTVVQYIRDVHDRKRAEEKHQTGEEKFRRIFEATPDAVSITREHDGAFIDVNNGFVRLSGYTREEVLVKRLADFDFWVDPKTRMRVLDCLVEHGQAFNQEARFRRKNGTEFSALVSAVRLVLDGEPCFLAITRSLEEMDGALEALSASHERYRSMFEGAPVGIFHSTTDGKFIDVNPHLARILGYDSPDELITHANRTSIAETVYVDPGSRPELIERVIGNEGRWLETEDEYRRKGGDVMVGRLLFRRLAGEGEFLEGFIEDVTDKKRAGNEVKQWLSLLSSVFESTK